MSLMRNNFYFTIIWTMAFIMFFAYFFVTASIVAFEDGFDDTTHNKGYPADFAKASQWVPHDYLLWLLAWIPDEKLQELKEYLQRKHKYFDGPEEEEEKDDDGLGATTKA